MFVLIIGSAKNRSDYQLTPLPKYFLIFEEILRDTNAFCSFHLSSGSGSMVINTPICCLLICLTYFDIYICLIINIMLSNNFNNSPILYISIKIVF
ncbi:MAG TPA: hypothetical protein DIT07_12245 [Sphingobacteriaceae bacterium]|nr:hypothetical protein [Sphingobacteriaceae bacterium]